ncbi:hypothetical protein [Streptomyces qinglanensis]|uniref:hypothetical protein n=1 Tax=Streptomyces qinglanensis TaxID=943816 RepID=UPI003D70892F
MEGDGVAWPERTPLLLARIRPLPPSPGGMFINATAGLSKLELHAWHGAPTGVEADWRTVRNTTALRLGRRFRDEDGEAFWLVRDNPAASPDLVRSRRYRTHTRHALYGGQDQGRLALLICHGRCTHTADALEQLAADLGARPAGSRAAPTPPLPRRLAGAPGIELQEENGHTTLDRHDYAARFTWDVPLDAVTVTALAAHTVRLTAS